MATRQRSTLNVEGTEVAITNYEKVLFPEAGYTKGNVIEFYTGIADYLLPHLKDRPVTLKRYPDGIRAKHFYEKDAPKYTPKWVQTFYVPRRTDDPDIRYILINDLRTLVWSANLANLEIHPFLHRVPHIDRPDQITFDLDPGEGTDLIDCAEIALLLREVLAGMKLQSFPKVSGSKGMQIAVPLNTPAVTYEDTGAFAKALAMHMTRSNPSRVVWEMAKEKRVGKIFVDWSQNSDFKTTVGVYSLRAKRAFPFISMPVTWDEVETMTTERRVEDWNYSPEDALKRLEKVGDLWAPVLKLKQKLPKPSFEAKAPKKAAAVKLDFIEPMQALAATKLPEGPGWQYEVKFDGYRTEALCGGGGVQLLSRRANNMNERFAVIAKALKGAKAGTIFDGEVVALDDTGRPSFHALQNYRPDRLNLQYFIFDLLAFEGRDLTKTPLSERRRLLERKAIAGLESPVVLSPVLDAGADAVLAAVCEQGLEGIVAKRTSSVYEAGKRTGSWVKVRTSRGQEFVVGGYKPGTKSFEYLLIGYYDDAARLIFIAKLKNGFVAKDRKEVEAKFGELEIKNCPFANLPEKPGARRGEAVTTAIMPKLRWLKPELVVQVDFVDWTEANHLRHAKYVGIRDDKEPQHVRKDT